MKTRKAVCCRRMKKKRKKKKGKFDFCERGWLFISGTKCLKALSVINDACMTWLLLSRPHLRDFTLNSPFEAEETVGLGVIVLRFLLSK